MPDATLPDSPSRPGAALRRMLKKGVSGASTFTRRDTCMHEAIHALGHACMTRAAWAWQRHGMAWPAMQGGRQGTWTAAPGVSGWGCSALTLSLLRR